MAMAGGAATSAVRNQRVDFDEQARRAQSAIFQASMDMDFNEDAERDHPTLAGIRRTQIKKRRSSMKSDLPIPRDDHWVVDSRWFEGVIGAIVLLNAITMGIAFDITMGDMETVWKIVENVFTAIFFLEMLLKLKVLRLAYFKDRWNIFDFTIIIMSMIDNWILSWFATDPDSILGKLTIFRILRLARVARVFRMVRYFDELVALVDALIYSIKTMAWAYMLLFLMVYLYSVICVEFIGSNPDYPARSEDAPILQEMSNGWNNYQYFGTVYRAMYSLFSIITLSEFSVITRPVFEKQPVMVILLVSFTCLSAFGIMNVVVGLLVQQALEVSTTLLKAREEAHAKEQMERVLKIQRVLEELDKDGNKDITKEELKRGLMEDEELMDLLVQIDLPPNISVDEVFTLIDYSGDGHVSPEEFSSQLMRMINCTHFQQLCLMQISMNHIKSVLTEKMNLNKLGTNFTLEDDLDGVCESGMLDGFCGSTTRDTSRGSEMAQDQGKKKCSTVTSENSVLSAVLEMKGEISKLRDDLLAKIDDLSGQKSHVGFPEIRREDVLLCFRAQDATLIPAEKIEGQGWEQLPDWGLPVRIEGESFKETMNGELLTVPNQNGHAGVVAKGSSAKQWNSLLEWPPRCPPGSAEAKREEKALSSGRGLFMGDRMPLTTVEAATGHRNNSCSSCIKMLVCDRESEIIADRPRR